MLDGKDLEVTGSFAKQLHKSIAARYTLPQLDDILLVSFFDPHWQLQLPKWAVSKRITTREILDLERRVKREVVNLALYTTPIENALKTLPTSTQCTGSAVCPSTLTAAFSDLPSSHHSNMQSG